MTQDSDTVAQEASPEERLRIVPLGGLGEIGKNCMAVEYGQDILVIDAGLMFPTSHMLGVDFVIPDIRYLLERVKRIRAILITHAHEDHIGALPYIIPHVQVPIYGTELTLGLVRAKLKEFGLAGKAAYTTIEPGRPFEIGAFRIESFRVVHSISEGVGLAIHTSVGTVVHSGDFKLDQTPIDGKNTDFLKLAELGENGVLVLLSDSTYADRPGFSLSERLVGKTLDHVFSRTKGRFIIATFASSLPRIQQVIMVAHKHMRKIAFVGKSLIANVHIARDMGYLNIPAGMEVRQDEIPGIAPEDLVVLTTGSQGEPTSALTQMATNNHKWVKITPGDTVVLSATPVPGNEELVLRTINQLYRLGAEVIYTVTSKADTGHDSGGLRIHVSGHGSQEDLKLMLSILRPRFFVPIHGEYRHLVHHASLAREMGISPERTIIALSGDVLEFDSENGRVTDHVDLEQILVDGGSVGDIRRAVLRERYHLAQEGILIPVVAVHEKTGELLASPEIITRGYIYARESNGLIEDAKQIMVETVGRIAGAGAPDINVLKNCLKEDLQRFLYERTKRRPLTLPIVMLVDSVPLSVGQELLRRDSEVL
ncbi:MAG: ribonuclease J [Armatimonadetes bacterium]|nr:ribonuclease J [Armatimonadota bacterium]